MNCRCCNGEARKFGRFQNRNRLVQRFRCIRCGTTFSESQPLAGVRIETPKITQVASLLVEGVGIRAISRLTALNQETVLNVLATTGRHCERLLDEKIRNVKVDSVQVDELFAYVGCKQKNNKPNDSNRGDQYTFLAMDAKSKLVLNYLIGKRDAINAHDMINDLNERVAGRFQLTTDGFYPYKRAVENTLGERVDYAQLTKLYGKAAGPDVKNLEVRYSPPPCVGIRIKVRCGDPDPAKICTSHIERTNLSVRLFQRRFTRLTLGYSKKIEYLRHSVALFIAYFNFCRKHSTHGNSPNDPKALTPAQAAGVTDHAWSIEELLLQNHINT